MSGTIYLLKSDGSRRQTSCRVGSRSAGLTTTLVFSPTGHSTGIRILDVGSGAVAAVPPTLLEYAGSLPGGLD